MGELWPELAAPDRFGHIAARLEARGQVNGIVADWTRTLTRDEVLVRCAEFEVPCGPVYAVDEIFEDPQSAAAPRLGR